MNLWCTAGPCCAGDDVPGITRIQSNLWALFAVPSSLTDGHIEVCAAACGCSTWQTYVTKPVGGCPWVFVFHFYSHETDCKE